MSGMLIRWNILNIFQNRKPCVFPVPEGHIWCGANNLLFRRSGGVLADSPGRQANAEFQRFARISRIFYSIIIYYIVLYYILLLSIIIYFSFSPGQCKCTLTLYHSEQLDQDYQTNIWRFQVRIKSFRRSLFIRECQQKMHRRSWACWKQGSQDLKWFLSLCRCIGDIQYANDMDTHMFSFV
jgi:hypothetical protein